MEADLTGPSRGLVHSDALLYFRILQSLAKARLVRDDAAGCEAAVSRALALPTRPPKESRAELLALRARARFRLGRAKEADDDLRSARALVMGAPRARYDRERALLSSLGQEGASTGSVGAGPQVIPFEAVDRGEILLEVEGDFLPDGQRLRLVRHEGRWSGEARLDAPRPIRYRFVADGDSLRPDPAAPRVVVDGDVAWCTRP